MYYPDCLKKNDTIGICAPSAGVGRKLDEFDKSLSLLKHAGYKIKETASVRVNDQRSADARTRAIEFTSLFKDPDVDLVMCAAGGDFLFEILPYVHFKEITDHPKWFCGMSDPTTLLYTLTSKYDIATLYGFNAGGYDERPVRLHQRNSLAFLKGELPVQRTSRRYVSKPSWSDAYNGYDADTHWESPLEELHVTGRCIGGCIDALKDLFGTPYDGTKDFLRRYKEDGTIYYFDNFALSAENLYRTLLQMRYAGWFKNTRVILFGRTLIESSETGMSYEEALQRALGSIPYIYNMDIGHTSPCMTMINGALLHLDYKHSKGTLQFEKK